MADIGTSMDTNLSILHHASSSGSNNSNPESAIELQYWAEIERLPTSKRVNKSLVDRKLLNDSKEKKAGKRMVDVTKLGAVEKHMFIDELLKEIEEDNLRLLKKQKERIDRVGLELPSVEVRYRNLFIEAECKVVHGKPIPTLWSTLKDIIAAMRYTNGYNNSQVKKQKIINNVSGIIKPSRLTLLLGPPGCGKTTLLRALAGTLDQSLKFTGEISYNGYKVNEFVPQKTSAYISQYDLHISEMTVRETLDFSARCQGIGDRADIMKELCRREKQAGIIPESDIDTYMKATSIDGLRKSLQTDYILKILGLDYCADTLTGDMMNRGISGGQKRRLTTGEMIIGPTKALFMDEISNGLDSSTTFQIVTCVKHLANITGSTILLSLLQPAPETFDLFDDIILMAEGKIVYHGPRKNVLAFFEHCGFRCPPRKNIADFLQEVLSKKDQPKYWYHEDRPYTYISVNNFERSFKEYHLGEKLNEELSWPVDKSKYPKNALSFETYSLSNWELFKACIAREWLLIKRNSFVHVFKSTQLLFVGMVTMTVFIRSRMSIDLVHASSYMGAMFYTLIRFICLGLPELSLTASRLAVFYKQRDFYFYPAWTYFIPAAILKIPFSLLDAFLWTSLTYYVIGYSPELERFFSQFFILFLVHLVSVSMFSLIASIFRNPSVAAPCSLLTLIVAYLFSGFVIPKSSLPTFLKWGFWISPLAYAEIGISLNEFLAPRWQKDSSSNVTLGHQILMSRGLDFSAHFYWISAAALVGYWMVFNIAITLALSCLKAPGRAQTLISHVRLSTLKGKENLRIVPQEKELPPIDRSTTVKETEGMGVVLPFEPITISFENVQYYVDAPKELRKKGFPEKSIQLLQDITGVFRPGVLTALMGVSGAGKTTLMDVLSGRKTAGHMEGEIRIGGYPKVQDTYSRISGYCEQSDIHSPLLSVGESVAYSARLRLPAQIDKFTRLEFVAEVLQLIELDEIKDGLVGSPGISGISTEQRKRLTIAVELVSNPSIIFMDEPTSGLDARAAAIVMRVVKNIVSTGRTVVCTIHQPSIDIFEAFDELMLLKKGGQIIYSGELGQNSSKLIEYLEGVPGVPKIKENYNPATWMLEVTSPSAEAKLELDFASFYQESKLCRENRELVKTLSSPVQGSKELHFCTRFPLNGWQQFTACIWKLHLTYWRSPHYNLARYLVFILSSLLFGALLWQKGKKIESEMDIINIQGGMFILMQFMGICNCSGILPYIFTERNVAYRERFSGMYSLWAYSFAQVAVEIPYIFFQAVIFTTITYPVIGFYWSAYKVFWYFYTMFSMLLFYSYFGMLFVSLTPTYLVASVLSAFSYTMLNLFAGFLIPGPKIPKWWVWAYWICPSAWSLQGFLSSQYGDIKEIMIYGESTAINAFVQSYYGYKYDELVIVAVVLLAFPLVTAFAFAYAMAKLNFQRR
ncbi:hypothetical protein RGQ29_008643 [Quercus rubra]|uniref:ABC transporter domain-containing protein n=1 Tax=Quercus rubra TaxID=3512 RepID=A0AAN7E0Q4_QUERU|nr:hypothetical protein RGQ29_008643 [Quercus rubra]